MFWTSKSKTCSYYNLAPGRGVNLVTFKCVCLSVHLHVSKYVQTSQNFVYMLPVAITQSSFDDNVICYVLPVLWWHHVCYFVFT